MIFEFDYQTAIRSLQCTVYDIKEGICSKIISWLKSFSLEHPPKDFGDVKMWGIGRQEEELLKDNANLYWNQNEKVFHLKRGGIS